MKGNIEERAVALAEYIIDHGATVRAAAAKFGLSKSTVHTVVAIGVGSQWSLRLPAKRPRSNEKGDGLKPSPPALCIGLAPIVRRSRHGSLAPRLCRTAGTAEVV